MDRVDTGARHTSAAGSETVAWPALLRIRPSTVLAVIGGILAVAWTLFISIDLFNVFGISYPGERPMWLHMFNDRPVEFTQWFVMAPTVLLAGYVAGRVAELGHRGAASFFTIFGIAVGLMLVEEAGDVRHVISSYVERYIGEEVFGLHYMVFSDVPYFAALALVPIYAILRYGKHVWKAPSARPYLLVGYALYGLAGGASGIRHHNELYIRVGARVDEWLFGGRFPPPRGLGQGRTHFLVVDSVLEESIELIAAACLLAVVVAFVYDLRNGRLAR